MNLLERWLQRRRDEADARVLFAIRAGHHHGMGIWRATGLSLSRLYPALARLAEDGAIIAAWEELPPGADRPRRRTYRLAP